MKVVEDIKDFLSKNYDGGDIDGFFNNLSDDDMMIEMGEGETKYTISHGDYEIETLVKTYYNHNSGFITVFKDEDLQEVIPFNYEVDPFGNEEDQ